MYFLYLYLGNSGAAARLEWNIILSAILADIPVGLILWIALQRRDSKNRKLLDHVEKMKVRELFHHLEVHYCDKWDSAEYPYLHYYLVNTKTTPKFAYEVDDAMQELIETGVVRKYPRHRDLVELNRYFEANNIQIEGRKPEGDDLSLGANSSS